MNKNIRSFNTVSNSSLPRREQKARRQRMAILSAFVVLALIVVVGIALLISSLVDGSPVAPAPDTYKTADVTVGVNNTKFGDLVLVNDSHEYTFPENNSHLAKVYETYAAHGKDKPYISGVSEYMEAEALAKMDALLTEFYNATKNNNIILNEAYRDYDYQKNLISSSIEAGFSDHHTGLGCTLKIKLSDGNKGNLNDNNEAYNWITKNAAKYGFIVRYPENKKDLTGIDGYAYYFRYVGSAHATYMAEHDLCLEEYIETIKEYTADKPLRIKADDGDTYEVYYAKVDGDTTVKCPVKYDYNISGTNEGGVIVTANLSLIVPGDTDTAQ